MSKAVGYSLWLVPDRESETYGFLDQLIREVATKYRTPIFAPHVTLIGGIESSEQDLREKTQALAEKLTPYEIQLEKEVCSNGIYLQILFSKVKQTFSVLGANTVAQRVFRAEQNKYFPHFSFAYGNLSDKQIASSKEFVLQKTQASEIRFLAQGIELWHADGAVEGWRKVAYFHFRQP